VHPTPLPGKAYLDILGKILVFLLVFRSKLSYDRFWAGRIALAGMGHSTCTLVTDTSVFFEADTEEQIKCRGEVYRLALATYVCMLIHIRKDARELVELHRITDVDDKGYMAEEDARQITALVSAGLLTEEEKTKVCGGGMSYVNVCATLCAQKLKSGFQASYIHRNLMMDVDGGMKKMLGAWSAAQKTALFPFPFPYIQALTIFNLLFLATLPMAMVQSMGPWTAPAVGMITLGFLGLDTVGGQLEDPFGTDANDLDLGSFAQDTADACFVALRARDGAAVKLYEIGDIINQ